MTDFGKLSTQLGELVTAKNQAYGDSFAKCQEILKVLYPNGIAPDQYRDALGVVRVIDKLFRIANKNGNSLGESAWKDIAGYGLVGWSQDDDHMG